MEALAALAVRRAQIRCGRTRCGQTQGVEADLRIDHVVEKAVVEAEDEAQVEGEVARIRHAIALHAGGDAGRELDQGIRVDVDAPLGLDFRADAHFDGIDGIRLCQDRRPQEIAVPECLQCLIHFATDLGRWDVCARGSPGLRQTPTAAVFDVHRPFVVRRAP